MKPRVRPATVADAPEIAAVHVESWRAAYADVLPSRFLAGLSVDERCERWTRTLSDGAFDVFVAELDGQVAGFASTGASEEDGAPPDEGELFALYVHPATWGRGCGRLLLARAEGALRDAGFDQAVLWVLEANSRARSLYEAEGWATDGGRKQLPLGGVDAGVVRYRKRLR
jgi:ribosomal protein S18 acetylase RimI-like enzyme